MHSVIRMLPVVAVCLSVIIGMLNLTIRCVRSLGLSFFVVRLIILKLLGPWLTILRVRALTELASFRTMM